MATDEEVMETELWPSQPDPSWPYTPLYDGLTEIFNKAIVLRTQITGVEEPDEQTDREVQKKLAELAGVISGLVDTFGGKTNVH